MTLSAFHLRRFSFSILFFSLLMAGGLRPAFASPEAVVHQYFEAFADNNVEGYLSCIRFEPGGMDLPGVREMAGMLVGRTHSSFRQLGGIESVRTVILKQDGNTATVGAYLLFHNGSIYHGGILYLLKEEDWKIDLSPLIE